MPNELRREETIYYTCSECCRLIDQRLPRGLTGEFKHAGCVDLDKAVARGMAATPSLSAINSQLSTAPEVHS